MAKPQASVQPTLTREYVAQNLYICGRKADSATVNRIMSAKPRSTANDPVPFTPKPFNILR